MKAPRRKTFWTAEEDTYLMAAFNRGEAAAAIATALGRSRQGVMRRRQSVADGLVDYWPKKKWTPQDDATLIAMLNAGQGVTAIGRALGRSRCAVHTRTDLLRARQAPLPPTRLQVARDVALHPIPKNHYYPFITDEDREWMNYWRQPRAVRKGLPSGVSP
jgi:hypothetical protein